jgi:hypothetical protein
MNQQYEIIGLRTFWTIINAREYGTVQAAVDAASAGTCVFFDAGDDFESSAVTVTNNNIMLMGCGPESTLKLSSSGAGPLIRIGPAVSNIVVANMTLEGAAGAAGSDGIEAQQVTNLRLENLIFTGFKGEPIKLINDTTAGNACVDCSIINCRDTLSTGTAILVNDVDGLVINGYLSDQPGGDGINIEADGAASFIRDIQISNCRVESPTGKGIYIASNSGTADDKWSRVSVSNTKVISPTDDGIQVGDTSKIIRNVTISDCEIEGTVGADGFVVNAQRGKVSNCTARANAVGADGLDMLDSEDLFVSGCHFQDAGANGIDCSSIPANSDCTISNNNVRSATTEGIAKPTGIDSGLECVANVGDVNKSADSVHASRPNTGTSAQTDTVVYTYTIPGGTITKAGDGLRVNAALDPNDQTLTTKVKLAGASYGEQFCAANQNGAIQADIQLNDNGINSANNTDGWSIGVDNAGNCTSTQHSGQIDWRSDVDLTITLNNGAAPGGISVLEFVRIEFLGGDFT